MNQSVIPHLARAIRERRVLSTSQRLGVPLVRDFTCVASLCMRSPTRGNTAISRIPYTPSPAKILKQSKGSTSPENGTPTQPAIDPVMNQKGKRYLVITFCFATFMGVWISFIGTSWMNDIKKHAEEKGILPQNSDVSDRWRQLGRDYDDEIELAEQFFNMDIKGKRKRLVSQAYGKVLEVSAGTGRNFEYYDLKPFDATNLRERNLISSLTINDQSPVMIATAERKFEEQQERAGIAFSGKVKFTVGDAGIRGVIERPEGGYDTIIETMGLCSMVDPVGFLKTMGMLCRQPGESSKSAKMQAGEDDGKGGRILLLEHGRSRWEFINKVLDSGASMHADHYGCWWNKDISDIVTQSGLEIERVRRYHFGTTWEIHLRPTSK